jgi:hypothetical protein
VICGCAITLVLPYSNRMQYGELLKSEERVEDVSDGVTYVKVHSVTRQLLLL